MKLRFGRRDDDDDSDDDDGGADEDGPSWRDDDSEDHDGERPRKWQWVVPAVAGLAVLAAVAVIISSGSARTTAPVAVATAPTRSSAAAPSTAPTPAAAASPRASLTSAVPAKPTPEASTAAATPQDAAVAELNRYRAAANLPLVDLDPKSPAPLHAHYLSLNKDSSAIEGLNAHTERRDRPGYTDQGAMVAASSNISDGHSTIEGAVRALVDVPLHRAGMLDPGLSLLGVGFEGGYSVLDLSSSTPVAGRPPVVVPYPGPGQLDVPVTFPGHEIPDPLSAISDLPSGATLGYAVTLQFYGCDAQTDDAQLLADSQSVPVYLVKPGTTLTAVGGTRTVRTVIVFARTPFAHATRYTARIRATCGTLGTQTYVWSFTTRAALDIAASEVAVSAARADGWQTISIRLSDTAHRPAEGAALRAWHVQFPGLAAGANKPEVRADQDQSGADGLLVVGFRLGDAPSADVRVDLGYDGDSITLPVHVTPDGSGHLSDAPASTQLRIDETAREAWNNR